MSNFDPMACPFCNEDNFDIYGLQLHLQGRCENFGRYDSRNNLIQPCHRCGSPSHTGACEPAATQPVMP